jgi:hypothetical protein
VGAIVDLLDLRRRQLADGLVEIYRSVIIPSWINEFAIQTKERACKGKVNS